MPTVTEVVESVRQSWQALDAAVQASLISALATLFAAAIGFTAVVVQIGRQARAAIVQQRHLEAMKLKLRIYEDVIAICDRVTNADTSYSSYVALFAFSLENAASQRALGLKLPAPTQRYPDVLQHQQATSMAAIEVITTAERWAMVEPRLDVFQTAINVALHDLQEAHREFQAVAMRHFPLDVPNGEGAPSWNPPEPDELTSINAKAHDLALALGVLGGFIHDFRVEMQRTLLSDLFDYQPPVRAPIDPRYVAVSLENRDALMRYFENETPWGKMKARAEADVRATVQHH